MLMLNQLVGFGPVAVAKPIEFTYDDEQTDATAQTTKTFSSIGIGVAQSDRIVVAVIHFFGNGGARTISSVTIGGVTATIHENDTANQYQTVLVSAVVATGTTGDVVVTSSAGSPSLWACQTYSIRNADSSTPTGSDTIQTTSPSSQTVDINVSEGGIAIVGASGSSNTAFDGFTGADQDFNDATIGIGNASASRGNLTADSTYTIGADPGANSILTISAIAFR